MTNRRELADRLEGMASAQPMLLTMPPQETDGAKALREAARLLREPVAPDSLLEEAVGHLRAMSHVAPRTHEVNAAYAFLNRLDAERKGGEG